MATEIGGLIYGKYAGSVKDMSPGGLSCENSYMPHGESYEAFKHATSATLEPMLAGEDVLGKSRPTSILSDLADKIGRIHAPSQLSLLDYEVCYREASRHKA